jgi:hypothetical protein
LALRKVLNGAKPKWWLELLSMEPTACDRLVGHFAEMTREETRAVAAVARDLPGGLGELLALMGAPTDRRDPLRDAERRDALHLMLALDSSTKAAGLRGYDPAKPAEFHAPPPRRVEVVAVGAMGDDRRLRLNGQGGVEYVDRLSEQLGVRPFAPVALDTTGLGVASRARVNQFVMAHGNTLPGTTDRQWAERKAALTEQAELMKAKGRYWADEAERRKVRLVREQLGLAADAAKVRRSRAAQARAAQRKQAEDAWRAAAAAAAKARLIVQALESAAKWDAQQRRAEATALRERFLLADLVTSPGPPEKGRRQQQGRSYLLEEWGEDGVPLTAAAAAVTFGAALFVDRAAEVAVEVEAWRAKAVEVEALRERRGKRRDAADRRAEKEAADEQVSLGEKKKGFGLRVEG